MESALQNNKQWCNAFGCPGRRDDNTFNLRWLGDDEFSEHCSLTTDTDFSCCLNKYNMRISYSVVVVAHKNPDDCGISGYLNSDLACAVFLELETIFYQPWMLAAWECTDEGVFHLHCMTQFDGCIDGFKKLLNKLGPYTDITLSCVKAERTKVFKSLFKYFMKAPYIVLSNRIELLQCAWFALRSGFQWTDKHTSVGLPIADDILALMTRTGAMSFDELVKAAPGQMYRYLQTPNIHAITDNCRSYVTALINTTKSSLIAVAGDQGCCLKIHHILRQQYVDVEEFDSTFYQWITLNDAKNTLVLQGPSNTGKSAFIRSLLPLYKYAEITNSNPFMYQNCVGKQLLVWEKPLLSATDAEKF